MYPNSTFRTASARKDFAVPLSVLWSVAGHPAKLAGDVPMLQRFDAPKALTPGAKVSEIHTILGLPRQYVGQITAFEEEVRWTMTSRPESHKIVGLPHNVSYRFTPNPRGSSLQISCDFECLGFLTIPPIPWIVTALMSQTLARLLCRIEMKLQERNKRYLQAARTGQLA